MAAVQHLGMSTSSEGEKRRRRKERRETTEVPQTSYIYRSETHCTTLHTSTTTRQEHVTRRGYGKVGSRTRAHAAIVSGSSSARILVQRPRALTGTQSPHTSTPLAPTPDTHRHTRGGERGGRGTVAVVVDAGGVKVRCGTVRAALPPP